MLRHSMKSIDRSQTKDGVVTGAVQDLTRVHLGPARFLRPPLLLACLLPCCLTLLALQFEGGRLEPRHPTAVSPCLHAASTLPALTLWQAALKSSCVHSRTPAGHASVRLCQHLPHSAAEFPACTDKHTSVMRLPRAQDERWQCQGAPPPLSQEQVQLAPCACLRGIFAPPLA